jgi:hypothetical protein
MPTIIERDVRQMKIALGIDNPAFGGWSSYSETILPTISHIAARMIPVSWRYEYQLDYITVENGLFIKDGRSLAAGCSTVGLSTV